MMLPGVTLQHSLARMSFTILHPHRVYELMCMNRFHFVAWKSAFEEIRRHVPHAASSSSSSTSTYHSVQHAIPADGLPPSETSPAAAGVKGISASGHDHHRHGHSQPPPPAHTSSTQMATSGTRQGNHATVPCSSTQHAGLRPPDLHLEWARCTDAPTATAPATSDNRTSAHNVRTELPCDAPEENGDPNGSGTKLDLSHEPETGCMGSSVLGNDGLLPFAGCRGLRGYGAISPKPSPDGTRLEFDSDFSIAHSHGVYLWQQQHGEGRAQERVPGTSPLRIHAKDSDQGLINALQFVHMTPATPDDEIRLTFGFENQGGLLLKVKDPGPVRTVRELVVTRPLLYFTPKDRVRRSV